MAGLVDRLPMGGLALSIAACLVVRSAVVAAHGQHNHLIRRRGGFSGIACTQLRYVTRTVNTEDRERTRSNTSTVLAILPGIGNDGHSIRPDGTPTGTRSRGGTRMTPTRTVAGLSRLLVLVPVTVCATISYFNELPPRCNDRTPPPQTLALCKYDNDCIPNAYCWNQEACLCKDGYIAFRDRKQVKCLKEAEAIGDPCEVDDQCRVTFAPYAECRQNVCQCSDGSHYIDRRCYESIGLGQPCQTSRNCYIKDSYCVTGFCACGLKHHPNPRNDGCIESIELGKKCSFDYECVAENSRCMDVCSCKVDHVLSNDGKRCLRAANSVGEWCQEDSQCQMFLKDAECGSDGRCSCVVGYHQRGPVCFRDAFLNERCESHRECVTESHKHSNFTEMMNVDCVNGVCTCAKDYIMTEEVHDCVRYSDNGAAPATSWRNIPRVLPLLVLTSLLVH